MKTILKIFTVTILILSSINISTSQTNYYETTQYYISIYRPNPINPPPPPGGTVYFDLSNINSPRPDIATSLNARQLFFEPIYQYSVNGNWDSNLGSGVFSSPSAAPFFPTITYL